MGVKKKTVKIFFSKFLISFCILTVDRFIIYSQALILPKDMISAIQKIEAEGEVGYP